MIEGSSRTMKQFTKIFENRDHCFGGNISLKLLVNPSH